VLQICQDRDLLWAMVARDWHTRYRASVLGLAWAFLVPIALVAIYTFFFAGLLQVKLTPDSTPLDFAFFLMCANLPWSAFSESIHRSSTVVADNRNLIKRVVFPLRLFPPFVSLAPVINEVIGLAIFVVAILILRGQLSPTLWLLPVLVLCRVLFTYGITLTVASIGPFLPDMSQFLNILLTAWMFLTPIFYSTEAIPATFRWIIEANPTTWIINSYRNVVLYGTLPDRSIILLVILSACLIAIGNWWYSRLSPQFADVV
jgi:lipopolysaccharide transport system permease protein